MSIVNTMLRDLDARGDNQRAARIPVRKVRDKRKKYLLPTLLSAATVIALGYAGWQQFFAHSENSLTAINAQNGGGIIAPLPAALPGEPAGQTASVASPAANSAAVIANAAPEKIAPKPSVQWSWSGDGFSLQLPHVDGLRYGVERVAPDTLRITLALSSLAAAVVPTPTPAWVDSVRVQQDDVEQRLTIRADARLEYDIAANANDSIVVSAWRSDERTAQASTLLHAGAVETGESNTNTRDMNTAVREAEVDEINADLSSRDSSVAEQRSAAPVVARAHKPPQVIPTQLTPAQQDERIAAQAGTQLRAGDTQAALAQLRAATQRLAVAPRSAALLVTVLMSQQRANEAQPILAQALQQSPDDIALRKLNARLLAARGDPSQALAQLSALQKQHTQDAELLALCASLAQQSQDYPLAANYYLQWSRLEPRSGAAWYGLALSLDAQGSASNAVAAYRQALTLVTDSRLRNYASTRVEVLAKVLQGKPDTSLSVAREGT